MTEQLGIPCRCTQCDWLERTSMRCCLPMPRGRGEESWIFALADCPMSRLLMRVGEDMEPATARFHIAVLHAIDTACDEGRLLPEAAALLRAAGGDIDHAHAQGGDRLKEILNTLEATRQAEIRRRSPIQRAGGPAAVAAMATAVTILLLWGLSLLFHPASAPVGKPRIEHIAWVKDTSPKNGRRKLEITITGNIHPIVTLVLAGGRAVRLYPPPSAQRDAHRSERRRRTLRLPEDGPGWALPAEAVLVVVLDETSAPSDLPARIAALPLLPVWLEAEIPGLKALLLEDRTR